MYIAHQFGEFSDRMTPAAAIPMHTPQEAIDELEYAVKGTWSKGGGNDQHGAAAHCGDRADFRRDAQRGHVA